MNIYVFYSWFQISRGISGLVQTFDTIVNQPFFKKAFVDSSSKKEMWKCVVETVNLSETGKYNFSQCIFLWHFLSDVKSTYQDQAIH